MEVIDFDKWKRKRKIKRNIIYLILIIFVMSLIYLLILYGKEINLSFTGYFIFERNKSSDFNLTNETISNIFNDSVLNNSDINSTHMDNFEKDKDNINNLKTNNKSILKNNGNKEGNKVGSGGFLGGGSQGSEGNNIPLIPPSNNTETLPNNTRELPQNNSNVTIPDNSKNNSDNVKIKFKLKNLKKNIKFYINNNLIDIENLDKGKIRPTLYKLDKKVAEFDFEIDSDIDFSDLIAESDEILGKAYFHTQNNLVKNKTLYIPRKPNQNSVLICENATSFSQIYKGCSNQTFITKEYLLKIGDKDLEISTDGKYFIIKNINGTGGESLIYVSFAEHLDNNKNFISDVFDLVKEKDDNWSEMFYNYDYLRVVFEKNISYQNYISIYAKSFGSSTINIYSKDDLSLISSIDNISSENYYRAYLTNLSGSYDSFDLQIVGDPVSFDYVVDPVNQTLDTILNVWDESDVSRNLGEQIDFFANYSDIVTLEPLSTAECNITFDAETISMSYNSTLGLFKYNKSFNSIGTYQYQVKCSLAGYSYLTLFDFVSIDTLSAPNGVKEMTVIESSSFLADSPSNISAYSGNVTEVDIFGYSSTQSWQGYYGNVSGGIELMDSNSNVLYNWSSINPKGEIYAARTQGVNFASIQCANSSQFVLEESYLNQSNNDSDSVTNTFNQKNHPLFYTGKISISTNSCNSTNLFDSSGYQNTKFYEVLLSDSASNIIYTSILEDSQIGFNNRESDFEMIVGENGHLGDVSVTTYYFYIELQ